MKPLTVHDARSIARKAFIYGYPMVDSYRVMWENNISNGLPFNALVGTARLFGPTDTSVVTPNNDTAYSQGWLDLGTEPIVLQVPEVPSSRYYSFQIIDAFTNNVSYIGTLTTGTAPGNYVLAGPGALPEDAVVEGATIVQLPGRYIFLLGRTQILGPDDVDAAQAIMDQYNLIPLSTFVGGTAPEPVAPPTFLPIQSSFIQTLAFFEYLNLTLTFQTPPASDQEYLDEFAKIGVGPGLTFDPTQLEPEIAGALQDGILIANQLINKAASGGQTENGWNMPVVNLAYFGTTWKDYDFRALVARAGIYANSPSEAIYYRAYNDSVSAPLAGQDQYTLTFPDGQLPPAEAFWSVTMYGADQYLVANSIDRYSLGSSSTLNPAADGSVTLQIQANAPADQTNWLPSPAEGPFYLVLRVYGPENLEYVAPGLVIAT